MKHDPYARRAGDPAARLIARDVEFTNEHGVRVVLHHAELRALHAHNYDEPPRFPYAVSAPPTAYTAELLLHVEDGAVATMHAPSGTEPTPIYDRLREARR